MCVRKKRGVYGGYIKALEIMNNFKCLSFKKKILLQLIYNDSSISAAKCLSWFSFFLSFLMRVYYAQNEGEKTFKRNKCSKQE